MNSVGLQLIASVIGSQNLKEYVDLHLKDDLFNKTELSAYKFVDGFIRKHGKIPEEETFYSEVDEVEKLPDAKEPPSYYFEEIKKRFIHKALTGSMIQSKNLLIEDKNPEKALENLTSICIDLQTRVYDNSMVDFRDAYDYVIPPTIMKAQSKEEISFGIKTGWESLDQMSGGLLGGDLVSYIGRPACLSGNTKIWVSRKPDSSGRFYTLEELYRGFNGGKAKKYKGKKWDLSIPTRINSLKEDNLIGLNDVLAVVKSGVKVLYRVTTKSGNQIDATKDHKFKVMFGGDSEGFLPLSELRVGDAVTCRFRDEIKLANYKSRTDKEKCTKLPYSPYRTRVISGNEYHRVSISRLTYDAGLNRLSVDDFVSQLKNNPEHQLLFSDSKKEIHHIDGDHTNNAFDNLMLLSAKQHQKLHHQEKNYRERFKNYGVFSDEIVSIEYAGEDQTYDISMANPYNNFVANDFVVHNSGKTFMMLHSALNMWDKQNKRVMFVSMEMLPVVLFNRLSSMYSSISLTHLNKGTLNTKSLEVLRTKLKSAKQKQNPFWVMDGNLTATVEDIWLNARMLKPDVVVVDGAYLLGHPNNRLNRFERVADNCRLLKNSIATDMKIPVVTSWQFNREATKKAKKGGSDQGDLEDIGFSDEIGQLSSLVLGLYQKESVETMKFRDVKILKGRNGEAGQFSINWDFYKMNFDEVSGDTGDLKYE